MGGQARSRRDRGGRGSPPHPTTLPSYSSATPTEMGGACRPLAALPTHASLLGSERGGVCGAAAPSGACRRCGEADRLYERGGRHDARTLQRAVVAQASIDLTSITSVLLTSTRRVAASARQASRTR